MRGRSLQKCFLCICLFFICPKIKFRTMASFPSDYTSSLIAKRFDVKDYSFARRSMRIMREDEIAPTGLAESEPGFNLTNDEIIKFKIWPQGLIPYYIDDFSFDKVLRDRIRIYLDLTNRITGLRFVELPTPPADEKTRWVLFVNRQGLLNCADQSIKNFTNEGVQKVILGYDCLHTGGELAEVILALVGVPPQHNSPDRNQYIKVFTSEIIPEKRHLFTVLKDNEWLFHDVPYDFLSAGHYSLHKYTKNGFATINFLKVFNGFTGEGKGFSYKDIWKIRMLYNYISRKKFDSLKASDCLKLFEPGSNFSNYEPLLEDILEPRNKPNKYLGKLNNVALKEVDSKAEYAKSREYEQNETDPDISKNGSGETKENKEEEDEEMDNKSNGFKEESVEENINQSTTKLMKVKNEIEKLKKIVHVQEDSFGDISNFGSSRKSTSRVETKFTKMRG